MAELPPELLRRWTHVHEEDSGDVRVYRPHGTDLPPARGRRGLELRPDGELRVYGPGPGDRPEVSGGRWEAAGEGRLRLTPGGDAEIVSVDPDRLELRWVSP